jgi:integrase
MRKAIARYESYTGYKDFTSFSKQQAVGFKKRLSATPAARGGGPISMSTVVATINDLKEFFQWLSWQRGYKGRINPTDIEFLNVSDNDRRSVHQAKFRPAPTMEQVRTVIAGMPTTTDIERRNRALLTMAILTGARDGALASLRLKHVDTDHRLVTQDPTEVRTKRRKRIDTFLGLLGDDLEQIVIDWVLYLREVKKYGDDDPVFPRTRVMVGASGTFEAEGIEPIFWQKTQPIREIFEESFAAVGMPYFSPHSFRHALVKYAERHAPSIEHFKAFSQNIGHEHVSTTLGSYGAMDRER